MSRLTWHLVVLIVLTVTWPARARADSIVLASGSALLVTLGGPGPRLTASLQGDGFATDFRWDLPQGLACFTTACAPGELVTLSTTLPGSNINTPPGENVAVGTATLNGVTMSDIAFDGGLTFAGPTLPLPPLPPGGSTEFPVLVSLGGPFTLTGALTGYRVLGVRDPEVLFTVDLFGTGTATSRFLGAPTGYSLLDTRYDVAPVPEPATMVLLGTGLVTAWVGRRRARRPRQDDLGAEARGPRP